MSNPIKPKTSWTMQVHEKKNYCSNAGNKEYKGYPDPNNRDNIHI